MKYLIAVVIFTIGVSAIGKAPDAQIGIGVINYAGTGLFLSPIITPRFEKEVEANRGTLPSYWERTFFDVSNTLVIAAVGSIVVDAVEKTPNADNVEARLSGVLIAAGIDLAGRSIYYLIAHHK